MTAAETSSQLIAINSVNATFEAKAEGTVTISAAKIAQCGILVPVLTLIAGGGWGTPFFGARLRVPV